MRARAMRVLLAILSMAAPTRCDLFVGVAVPRAGQAVLRAFDKTLGNLSTLRNLTLRPLHVELPPDERFGGELLTRICSGVEGRRVLATVVVGRSAAAAAVALAAARTGVPILRVPSATAPEADDFRNTLSLDAHPTEVRLESTAKETLRALRSLLLHTHWHSFTVLADSEVSSALTLRRDLYSIIASPPLVPKIVALPPLSDEHALFRRLADVSRSTRGVIVLVSSAESARMVTREARRLNMLDGHFVWVWIDTGSALRSARADGSKRDRSLMLGEDPDSFSHDEHNNYSLDAVRNLSVFNKLSARRPREGLHSLPVGLLALRATPAKTDRQTIKGAVRMIGTALSRAPAPLDRTPVASCWNDEPAEPVYGDFVRELRSIAEESLAEVSSFEILNSANDGEWKSVGAVSGRTVRLETILWPGGDIVVSGLSAQARSVFRIVTALAPPFVMESELDEDGQCLRGLPCHRVLTSDKDNLTLVFNEMETQERLEEDGSFFPRLSPGDEFRNRYRYRTNCCYGLSMDLLENIARELEFDFHLYIVSDGFFGTRRTLRRYSKHRGAEPDPARSPYRYEFRLGAEDAEERHSDEEDARWNGIVGDLVSGAAHMSFAALTVSGARSEVIDFSAPYFFSGVSLLAAPQRKSEIPLLAFLLPFSPELWIAIFTSLNVTAIAVAIYEWLSPFGLNPWGRQRSKNFSMSSALWVMWGLLCGHLVAFKAPKSWPNKFLINVWGGFSVIFVASYTANIAALIAGLFFHNSVDDHQGRSLFVQRVGAPRASAAEYYIQRTNRHLWDHMKRFALDNVEDGIGRLRNGSLDLLIADTPILDYYRATDHGCKLQRIGETINDDTYAIGMAKGFPLKESISALIAKYSSNGYMDILQEKWYGGLPCFKLSTDYGIQPKPLGVAAVAGVFLLLGVGMAVGCLILLVEHLFYRYTLPLLRHKPKGTIWRSRNIMFFSQKLYRFINCVELVSPHHAARELVHTLRQGQITSLFQKSVKRKEHEQRRRRKSKAQFFEMIQEIRRVQQEERDQPLEPVTEMDSETASPPRPDQQERGNFLSPKRSPLKSKLFNRDMFKSPRAREKKRKRSGSGLNVRRFSTDSVFGSNSMLRFENASVAIGRRLSKDTAFLTSSPPDINSRRSSYLDFSQLGPRSPNASTGGEARSFQNVSSIDREDVSCSVGDLPDGTAKTPVRRCFSQQTDGSKIRIQIEDHSSKDGAEEEEEEDEEEEEEEDELPPAPPYPHVVPRNSDGKSPLERLSRDELVLLWRSSESELRSHLLAALRGKEEDDPEPP